jgi:hypothetical protein
VLLLVECKEYRLGETLREVHKEFIFVVDSRKEAEDWLGAMEYLRTRATVRQFVSKFNVALSLTAG